MTTDPSELDGAPDAQDEVLLGDGTVPPAAAAAPSTGDAPRMTPPSPSGPAPAPATTPDDPEAPVPPAHTPSEPLDTDDEEVLGDPSVTHPVAEATVVDMPDVAGEAFDVTAGVRVDRSRVPAPSSDPADDPAMPVWEPPRRSTPKPTEGGRRHVVLTAVLLAGLAVAAAVLLLGRSDDDSTGDLRPDSSTPAAENHARAGRDFVPGVMDNGVTVHPDGTLTWFDGSTVDHNGVVTRPDGTVVNPEGGTVRPDGSVELDDGTVLTPPSPPEGWTPPPASGDPGEPGGDPADPGSGDDPPGAGDPGGSDDDGSGGGGGGTPVPRPTVDPNAPRPTVDPNAPRPTVDPNAPRPTIDPNAPRPTVPPRI